MAHTGEEKITEEDLNYVREHADYDYEDARAFLLSLFKEAGVEFNESKEEMFNKMMDAIIKKAAIHALISLLPDKPKKPE